MGKLKLTKWIFIGIVVAVIGALGAGIFTVMNDLMIKWGWCGQDDALCKLQKYGIIFTGLIIFGLAVDFAIEKKLFHKILSYFSTIKSNNIQTHSGFLLNNIFTLIFISTEWRYLFRETKAFVNIDPFVDDHNPSYLHDKFEWRNKKIASPTKIKRFVPYVLNFLEIDPKRNEFWIKTRRNKNYKFPCGEYGFEIEVVQNIYMDKINAKSVRPKSYLVVNYTGQRKISVRKVSKEEYEKSAWYKQINFENRVASNS